MKKQSNSTSDNTESMIETKARLAETRAKANLRQAIWEADQFMTELEIQDYMDSVFEEIDSDRS